MAENCLMPTDIVNTLKCSLCQKFLSVPPIMTSSNGISFKCGRCEFISADMHTPAVLYERLAVFMSFQCSHKNCNKKIPWKDVLEHENICPERYINCPMSACTRQVSVKNMLAHCKELHAENVFTNVFTRKCSLKTNNNYNMNAQNIPVVSLLPSLQTNYNYNMNAQNAFASSRAHSLKTNNNFNMNAQNAPASLFVCLLVHNSNVYLIYEYIDQNNFFLTVYSLPLENESVSNYEVKMISDKSIITISQQKIITFCEAEHCYMCLLKKCYSKFHKYSSVCNSNHGNSYKTDMKELMVTILKRASLYDILQNNEIRYTIKITESSLISEKNTECTSKEKITDHVNKHAFFEENKDVIRSSLSCQICFILMKIPVFLCKTGHTVCEQCKAKLKTCPICRSEFSSSRNFALEELLDGIKLPCQFAPNCKFVGYVGEIEAHEDTCSNCI